MISSIAESEILNEVMSSAIPFFLKLKIKKRLAQQKIKKLHIQQTLDEYL